MPGCADSRHPNQPSDHGDDSRPQASFFARERMERKGRRIFRALCVPSQPTPTERPHGRATNAAVMLWRSCDAFDMNSLRQGSGWRNAACLSYLLLLSMTNACQIACRGMLSSVAISPGAPVAMVRVSVMAPQADDLAIVRDLRQGETARFVRSVNGMGIDRSKTEATYKLSAGTVSVVWSEWRVDTRLDLLNDVFETNDRLHGRKVEELPEDQELMSRRKHVFRTIRYDIPPGVTCEVTEAIIPPAK